MAERAVADAGPLAAIVRTRETAHEKCTAALKTLRAPLLTCRPVLTEAAWLRRAEPGGMNALGGMMQSGLIRLVEFDETAFSWILAFLERYAAAGAQLADAAVTSIAEREGIDVVFTLDHRDFSHDRRPRPAHRADGVTAGRGRRRHRSTSRPRFGAPSIP